MTTLYSPEILEVFKPLNEEMLVSYNINSWLKDRDIESLEISVYNENKEELLEENLNKVITKSKCSFENYWLLFYLPQSTDDVFLEDKIFYIFAFVTTNDGLKKNFVIKVNNIDFVDQVIK